MWFGKNSRQIVQKYALDTAIKYSEAKEGTTPVLVTKSEEEVLIFTSLFQSWNGNEPENRFIADAGGMLDEYNRTQFTLDELMRPELPVGVDSTKKEVYSIYNILIIDVSI